MTSRQVAVILILFASALPLWADDWPQWRGEARRGEWNETGILERFPEDGLEVSWKAPIARGYAGPAVAEGRVFVTDFTPGKGRQGVERVLCLDERSGKVLWERSRPLSYAGLHYDLGPRATPTVDGDRVYVLGAMGNLSCHDVITGRTIWEADYLNDFDAELPPWGMVGAPLVVGGHLIGLVGGAPGAKVVSFDKMTGKEIWRALPSDGGTGYNPPFLIDAGGTRQVIVWHPSAISSLDPRSGKLFWEHPLKVHNGVTVATPVQSGERLLISAIHEGSRMFRLDPARPRAELLWRGHSNDVVDTDGLHSLITTPVIDGDYIYGICSFGQFRCLDARTGERVWETMEVTVEKARWASAQIVKNRDRYFINNDRGELIIARLSPKGYQEIDRTRLIKPTQPLGRRREFGAVHWSHPAYANRHIIVRNDEEIIRYSLAAE
ncbi:MAG: PQQ-binding-like beta-propeller repeat protein [bacterium]|nr:PQQ-binding-like beta-propeller repeat protein [bacterium]